MASEISNSLHAMCSISIDDSGQAFFVGQGNVGFAAFGHGDPDLSEHVAVGRYRMHLVQPVGFRNGEGLVIPVPVVNSNPIPRFPLAPPPLSIAIALDREAGRDIYVETQIDLGHGAGPVDENIMFELVVLRLPQQSTG